jgi:acyl-CoA oxidase
MTATQEPVRGFDPAILQRQLDGRYAELRNRIREVQCRTEFAPVVALPTAEYRERVMHWARAISAEGLSVPGFPARYGGEDDPGANVAAFETLGHGDLSLLVKFGVQFGLFGGSIQHLGTEQHHERYLRAIGTLELPGCFAMTEAGHGSNVQQLRTTVAGRARAGGDASRRAGRIDAGSADRGRRREGRPERRGQRDDLV